MKNIGVNIIIVYTLWIILLCVYSEYQALQTSRVPPLTDT